LQKEYDYLLQLLNQVKDQADIVLNDKNRVEEELADEKNKNQKLSKKN